MLKLKISKQSERFLRDIPLKHAQQLEKKLQSLVHHPFPNDSKKLKCSTPNLMRVDSGEYRIIYRIDKDGGIVIVLLIGKRNDDEVYKKLSRISHNY